MTEYFDGLETEAPEAREDTLFETLRKALNDEIANTPGWADRLGGIAIDEIIDRAALAKLPVLRKPELMEMQAKAPPFGGVAQLASSQLRLFSSPGPVYEPQGRGEDWYGAARAMFAAGIRKGDTVLNCFSYNMTPGGFIMDSGCLGLGAPVIPAGPGNTEGQLALIGQYAPSAYCGTPDFLQIILDKAGETGADVSCFKRALVSGGALFPQMRQAYEDRGIPTRQCYATADLGVVAYESEAMEGMIVNEGIILEIVTPGTGDPVPEGDVGEVVVTVVRPGYSLFRFGTGDLSAIMAGQSPCGRTNARIKGWMGRADQRTKVKGMFIDPEQIAAVAARHPGLARLRLEVTREDARDVMTLKAETNDGADHAEAVRETLQTVTKINGAVEFVEPGSLPNDGKVIDDQRDYQSG